MPHPSGSAFGSGLGTKSAFANFLHDLRASNQAARGAREQAGGAKMPEYCAYILGADDHILNRVDLICANEVEAKECAVRLVGNQNVELWQGDRKLAEFRLKATWRRPVKASWG